MLSLAMAQAMKRATPMGGRNTRSDGGNDQDPVMQRVDPNCMRWGTSPGRKRSSPGAPQDGPNTTKMILLSSRKNQGELEMPITRWRCPAAPAPRHDQEKGWREPHEEHAHGGVDVLARMILGVCDRDPFVDGHPRRRNRAPR